MPTDERGNITQATPEERAEVIELRASGKSYREIEAETRISKSSASRIWKEWKVARKLDKAQRTGRRPKLSERDVRHIKSLCRRDPTATIAELTADSQINVSEETVGRVLREAGLMAHKARRKPYLDQKKKRRRYSWCLLHKDWDSEKWKKGVFCDESVFNSGRGGNTKLVRRERGIDTAFQDQFLSTTYESGRFSQPFWAAIKHGKHTPLVPIRKRTPDERKHRDDKLGMDTDQYTHEILEAELIPFIKSLPGKPSDYFIVEDNLKAHTAKKPTAVRAAHGIERIEWPPSSPDLNPIENLWAICKRKVWKRMGDPSTRVRTKEEYIALCQREWEGLDWAGVDKMIEEMPERIRKCLEAKGGHTKY
jgi:transposase